MAYVIGRQSGSWELRESITTPAGPRSRTLATFRTLTPAIVEHAQARSSKPLEPGDLRKAAIRAGAPVAVPDPDRTAGELLAEIGAGRSPRRVLRRLLVDALRGDDEGTLSDSARAAIPWIAATPQRRAEALRDLLLLADRLPQPRNKSRALRFPNLVSTPSH
jgi:hypothetical protein